MVTGSRGRGTTGGAGSDGAAQPAGDPHPGHARALSLLARGPEARPDAWLRAVARVHLGSAEEALR
eukprot:6625512-Lingulodinium_polyedra.AAC.1